MQTHTKKKEKNSGACFGSEMLVRGVAKHVKCYPSRLKYVSPSLRTREQQLSAKIQQSLLVNF